MSEGRKLRGSWRGRAVPLMLAVLAFTIAACSHAGAGTLIQPAGTCNDFVTTVRTSQLVYAPGQTVIISVTQTNEGPGCSGIPPEWCGYLGAGASADNSAGENVWDSGAGKTSPGVGTCPFAAAPGPFWPAHFRNTQELEWNQDRCAWSEALTAGQPNVNCPGTPVAAGPYRIVGNETSAPATIVISSGLHSPG